MAPAFSGVLAKPELANMRSLIMFALSIASLSTSVELSEDDKADAGSSMYRDNTPCEKPVRVAAWIASRVIMSEEGGGASVDAEDARDEGELGEVTLGVLTRVGLGALLAGRAAARWVLGIWGRGVGRCVEQDVVVRGRLEERRRPVSMVERPDRLDLCDVEGEQVRTACELDLERSAEFQRHPGQAPGGFVHRCPDGPQGGA
ncbi:hypothetical protein HYFRA_00007473 [Hymenoscyphus fraxineus]|uniref:Uncharacterized protein n=1 Tax=Hymenoscyphus fraxineus TaxID=746836 RepID=A0A9N9KT63_9HELO|nr:hypothetical protein HYFRA_00007473 [Hymenoscyphus fraxineus]